MDFLKVFFLTEHTKIKRSAILIMLQAIVAKLNIDYYYFDKQ